MSITHNFLKCKGGTLPTLLFEHLLLLKPRKEGGALRHLRGTNFVQGAFGSLN